jgi:hypothetical protein
MYYVVWIFLETLTIGFQTLEKHRLILEVLGVELTSFKNSFDLRNMFASFILLITVD